MVLPLLVISRVFLLPLKQGKQHICSSSLSQRSFFFLCSLLFLDITTTHDLFRTGSFGIQASNKKSNFKGVWTLKLCHIVFIPRVCVVMVVSWL